MTFDSLFSKYETLQSENESLRAQLSSEKERLKYFESEISWLSEQLRELKRAKFGSKSEGYTTKEQLTFNEAEVLTRNEKPAPETSDDSSEGKGQDNGKSKVQEHERTRGKRRPLSKDIERKVEVIELPEEERIGANGQPLKPIGKEVSEKLHYEPSKLMVIEIHRIVYGEDSGDTGVVAPPAPSVIPKSYVTSGLLAEIVTKKYLYGLPFYRQEELFSIMGADVPRCTQARWVVAAAEACRPIWNVLEDRLLDRKYVSCDETWTQVLNEKNRKPEAKSWMWVRCTPADNEKIVLFDYDPSRSGEVAKRLFADYTGTLQVDGFAAYNQVENDRVTRIGCSMHARRKFESALKIGSKSGRPLAEVGMKYYRQLYKIEKDCRDKPPDERYEIRTKEALPIWEEFKGWAESKRGKVPPRSKIGEAITYFLNQYKNLIGYLQNGLFEIDNGFAERAIKYFAIGRKNWLFSDSVAGADASALFYSFIVMIKLNGKNPNEVLTKIFDEVPKARTIEDFERLADLIVVRPPLH